MQKYLRGSLHLFSLLNLIIDQFFGTFIITELNELFRTYKLSYYYGFDGRR